MNDSHCYQIHSRDDAHDKKGKPVNNPSGLAQIPQTLMIDLTSHHYSFITTALQPFPSTPITPNSEIEPTNGPFSISKKTTARHASHTSYKVRISGTSNIPSHHGIAKDDRILTRKQCRYDKKPSVTRVSNGEYVWTAIVHRPYVELYRWITLPVHDAESYAAMDKQWMRIELYPFLLLALACQPFLLSIAQALDHR
nr:hypothetical protein L203_02411 [Cryptococcus depauperatus CBS 7841]